MITTILNAIDDQEQSGRAVDAAIDIARATTATLIFFMANPAVMPGRGPLIYRYTSAEIGDYFSQARKRAKFGGVYNVRCVTKNCTDITASIESGAFWRVSSTPFRKLWQLIHVAQPLLCAEAGFFGPDQRAESLENGVR